MNKKELKEFINFILNKSRENEYLIKNKINLLDELHADENAHTRILLRLLELELDGTHPILNTLVNECINPGGFDLPNMKNPIIYEQKENMDGFVIDRNNYILVIENKINWAKDQDKQIERYVKQALDYAKENEIPEDKIFVLYLTDNGKKKVENFSLTDCAKETLNYKDERNHGRFLELTYREDILYILETVKSENLFEDEIVSSYLIQYIDYLQGRFHVRKNEEEYNRIMAKEIKNELGAMLTTLSAPEQVEKIEKLQNEIYEYLEKVKQEIYPSNPNLIAKDLLEFLKAHEEDAEFNHFYKVNIHARRCVFTYYRDALTDAQDHFFAIDIWICDDKSCGLYFHLIRESGSWFKEDVFNAALAKQEKLKKYLDEYFENKKESYYKKVEYQDIDDLYKKIKQIYREIDNNIIYR